MFSFRTRPMHVVLVPMPCPKFSLGGAWGRDYICTAFSKWFVSIHFSSFLRYDSSRVPSLPAQQEKRKQLLVAWESQAGGLLAKVSPPQYEREANMVASHTAHSDTPREDAVGGHTGKSLVVDSVLARQLSQQYFASVLQQSSSGVREKQPGAATEQVAAHYHSVLLLFTLHGFSSSFLLLPALATTLGSLSEVKVVLPHLTVAMRQISSHHTWSFTR